MFLAIFTFIYSSIYYVISFLFTFISTLQAVLPLGVDVGLLGIAVYYLTRLRKPDQSNVESIFGPEPRSQEGIMYPDRVVKCIAHRGAGFDAPENTLEALKYCVERDCNFVELDVRTLKDGQLVLLHDQGLERLTGGTITDVKMMDWDSIKNIDVGATHPNRHQFKEVHLCRLEDALDYLLSNEVRMIIDVKGEDKQVINGILDTFASRPNLYKFAAVTTFNPFILYQIRKKDPQIVGAISYRPYCFSAQDYDAENGPSNPRSEVFYWRSLGVRCVGWCVNRPLEKLYWRGVLKAPYLSNTLMGEPEVEQKKERDKRSSLSLRPGPIVDKILETEKRMTSGQN
ncbi:glycerophosphodiester phosphodiesterase 1 isoform X3 [Vanessa tameamea]|uniref:Glycerophosphodiester phosphodiesterase 1 isoform X3 n=1 Tax=Vanessa tameamea TaxID=334116 RepID=A0ABM4AX85_VANTA